MSIEAAVKADISELKKVFKSAGAVVAGVKKVGADKKVSMGDLPVLFSLATTLVGQLVGLDFAQIPGEAADLSEQEIKELVADFFAGIKG